MYENQTQEEIRNRMLNNISNEIDKREGSIVWDTVTPKSIELAQIYMELDNVLNFGFAKTTYGEFLDRKAAEAGLTRLPAQYAYCDVTFYGEPDTDIPLDSVVYTDSGLRYLTVENYTIGSDGTVNGRVKSENGGNEYNTAINTIINCEITGVEVNNITAAIGGEDEESDEKLLARYELQTQKTANSGSEDNYRQWALEHNSVGIVDVEPTWNGPGTVKVIILGQDKNILPVETINEVYEYIERVRPIGATVTVVSGTELVINISATISLVDGQTLETAETAIRSAVSAYLKQATLEEPDIKISKIITSIMGTGAISDYSDLLVNNDTVNIPLNKDSVAVLGTVTLTV